MTEPVRTPPPTWRERLELIASPPAMLTPGQIAAGAAVLLALVGGGWFLLREPVGAPPEDTLARADRAPAATTTTSVAVLVVDAAGAVVHPGVYRVQPGARVIDVVDAAGGPAADADVNRLNLAALVTDGSQIYVPRIGEAVPASAGGGSASAPSGPLDLNTATLEQLDALPGVGPATAKAILAERERRGRFRSVDELLDVRGIGPAKLDALRDLVKV